MRPVLFPTTLAALFDIVEHQPDARLMAGGTDLLVRLRQGPADRRPLICLERMARLNGITTENNTVIIGAATPLSAIIADPLVQRHCPLLARAAATVGGPAIRNMATLGGNICTASPAGDTLPPLYLLDARLDLAAAHATRQVPIAAFITGPGRTDLRSGELLTAIRIPMAERFGLQHFEKVGRRNALAIAVASLAALIRLTPGGRVAEARLAWGSVGPCVVRCSEAEARLTGRRLTSETLRAAGAAARAAVTPIDDIRATTAYRRDLVANLPLRLGAAT
ncbi:FAD binding domain-containing protein [Desulfatitalea alkaliphila]|uniref:FAD binding domain-containing protein n=1 Tax=Desulfatitalea alkaliphila TaxID=2929485 RepID=A0AA41UI19_9BACT|nr:FAD binding domain-containing protein [Desulfatitalea alkaliphila]MCJ8499182.1 FAD binding domain-containing protein [Desulfatitalea alkaliphila]